MELKDSMLVKMNESFALGDDDIHRYQNRQCVPNVDDLQTRIIAEAHGSKYSIHPGSTKMYHEFKQIYWWDGMKRDIEEYVAKCHKCQQVKVERTIHTLEDMLKACVIDFRGSWDDHLPLIEFSYNNSYYSSIGMAPFEALYGKRCRSEVGWFDVGKSYILGPKSIHESL
ncbi:uncharacterized protein [Solanum lycopersicum]|uniref:uncharacterized protein n=1 Tax=Solanum lycopersicum TaxID=4081 RepID=UPI003749AF07